nr:immunoglobulin heavy chain junction region [Macaca mulatta]MPO14407.1 immunoglobulin heavy chain junction region [Macaca mulatta]MPO14439.1 immunoglobulin heavy chain junction region [Macaca mulatta]MPO14442.1 immunoglobulin heavy chain junction region [Macaca mulatta]
CARDSGSYTYSLDVW